MIDTLKRFFGGEKSVDEDAKTESHDIKIATCAIFLEMANIDEEFSAEEQTHIVDLIKSRFGLDANLANELIDAAHEELKKSVDLWQFTNQVNQNYSRDEKLNIIESIWTLVLIDGIVDKHEDYLMRKLTRLLRLVHKDMIDTKLAARKRLSAES